jgi:hypothetical protein
MSQFCITLNTYIDKIVIGVDSLEHLKQNIEDLDFIEKVKEIYNDLDFLRIKDEDIILPYKWNLV